MVDNCGLNMQGIRPEKIELNSTEFTVVILSNYLVPSGYVSLFLRFIFLSGISRLLKSKGKGKSVPLQARSGPEGPRKFRFPDFMTTAQEGGSL